MNYKSGTLPPREVWKMKSNRLGDMPLVAVDCDDHDYTEVPIAPEAEGDPDKFAVIPPEFNDGLVQRRFARVPVVRLLTDVLAPIARRYGKRVVVKQAYSSREDKLQQWRGLFLMACTVRGYDPTNLTLGQAIACGELADSWGSYREVNPRDPAVKSDVATLKSACRREIDAIAKKKGREPNDIALQILSFRASLGAIRLPFTNSGFSVFMSGGHLDIELANYPSGVTDYYGVPGDLLDSTMCDRTFFEDDDNLEQFEVSSSHPQIRQYSESHFDDCVSGMEGFLMAQSNIRVLQHIAAEAGLMPWRGSVRTFSVPNNCGGKQVKQFNGYGDQSHAKKLQQPVAVWPRLTSLSKSMIVG